MTANNIILAVPGVDTEVNYALPPSESAQLSFDVEDIDGLRLDANGGLVISFVEGGNVTLTNFQSFIDNGNNLSFSDGTKVDPALVFQGVGGKTVDANAEIESGILKIGVPKENAQTNITLEPGQKYVFDFDLSETQGADIKDGKMVISFANGGKITLDNYEVAMASATPPELSITSKTCVVDGDDLITNIKQLAAVNTAEAEPVVVAEQIVNETKPQVKLKEVAIDDQKAPDVVEATIAKNDVTEARKANDIETASGDDLASQLANIDTAAGGGAGGRSGYGFSSRVSPGAFNGSSDTGPINATRLGYAAPSLKINEIVSSPSSLRPDGTPSLSLNGNKFVDETNFLNGNTSVSGSVNVDFGSDGAGGVSTNGVFSSSGSKLDGNLTSNGAVIVVAAVGNTYVGTISGGVKVFEIVFNSENGDYTYTQFLPVDHADGSNPNDVITLNFGIVASDSDGDTATATVQIDVYDDAPVANDDANTYDTTFGIANGNVISGLNGGVGAADDLSTDSSHKIIKIAFEGNEVDVPATGTVSIDGQYGTLVIAADGTYTYNAFDDGDMVGGGIKEFVSGPALPDFDESSALDDVEEQSLGVVSENLAVNAGDTVSVTFVSEGAGYGNTLGVFTVDAEGKLKAETVLIKNGNDVAAGDTYSYTASSGSISLGFFLVANGEPNNYYYQNIDFNTGTINFVYNFGQMGARDALSSDDGSLISLIYTSAEGVVTQLAGPIYFTTDRTSGSDNLNADDSVRVVSGIPGDDNTVLRIGFEDLPQLGDLDYNDMVFDISISGDKCGCSDEEVKDVFTYTLQDGDKDTSTATLTLTGQDLTDDVPALTAPSIKIVDETSLVGGTVTSAGMIVVDYGNDEPGSVTLNGSFTSTGSKLDGNLTSGGLPVVVSLVGNTYVGKAGDQTVFTLGIQPNGSYSYNQYEQFDHADGSNPNDEISLNFGITATDCDGDKSVTSITINVRDDAPLANDDGANVSEGSTFTGNVMSNDVVGQDVAGKVTNVSFNGVNTAVPASGNAVIVGTYGTLSINANGVYSYTANANADGVDAFTYTLRDFDGDVDTAVLSLCVIDGDTVPSIIKPAAQTVDETSLTTSTITQTGSVSADFRDDGPGSFAGNNVFTSEGSRTNNALTSNGVAVVVSYANGVYTGVAGSTTVFTLSIAANGGYTYRQFEQLDHADGSNANDVITLNFGVTATDTDGDRASTSITINVRDDAPLANDDACTVFVHEGSVSSNALSNDTLGADGGRVKAVIYAGTTYNVPLVGTVSISTPYGPLVIDSLGNYTYTVNSGAQTYTKNFTLVIEDGDGDTDTSNLQINIVNYTGGPINGTVGNDTIHGTSNGETINGNDGADWLWGEAGNDSINGGNGNDDINAGLGNDVAKGDAGDDVVSGREGDDTIYGGTGNDDLYGDAGSTATYGGNDTIYGEAGDDYISGGMGNDYISGGTENDILYGNAGVDTILGGAGNDAIIGGAGVDTLTGGAGADTFWYTAINEGIDRIKDFNRAEGDKFELSNVLAAFDPLTDAINDFVFATQSGGNTTILINNNGTGIGGATALAVLEGVNVSVTDLFNNGSIIV